MPRPPSAKPSLSATYTLLLQPTVVFRLIGTLLHMNHMVGTDDLYSQSEGCTAQYYTNLFSPMHLTLSFL